MVRYIDSGDDLVKVGGVFIASVDFGVSPEQLVEDFSVKKRENFSESKHSSRAMWPEEELDGIEFRMSDPEFEGHIHPHEIKINIDDISKFEEVLQILSAWLSETKFECPDKDEFVSDGLWILSKDDEYAISYDTMKCVETETIGHVFRHQKFEAELAGTNGFVVLTFYENDDGRRISIEKSRDFLQDLFEEELLIAVNSDETDSDLFN